MAIAGAGLGVWLYFRRDLREVVPRHGVIHESRSPLGQGKAELQDETIGEIARAHDATPAQVIIAWHLALGNVVFPKSVTPERIQENLPELGGGAFRTRGCFWVPTRPETLCVWDGAAGQLNIGTAGRWRRPAARRTDFVVTGLLAHGDPRDELRRAFETALCTPAELDTLAAVWSTDEDGLEPWLGDMKEYH